MEEKVKTVLKCIKCAELLMKPCDQPKEQFIGLVCGNNRCDRFGLITVVGKSEKQPESNIILPNEPKIIPS